MKRNSGFSLIELMVVIIIIGIIISSFFILTTMRRNAELQATMSQSTELINALKAAYDMIHEIPGDATSMTARKGEISPGCTEGIGDGTKTCNGNGNGIVEIGASTNENNLALNHVGLLGALSGNYKPAPFNSSTCSIDLKAGYNAPMARLKGGMWTFGSIRSGTPYTPGSDSLYPEFIPINVCSANTVVHFLMLGGSFQPDSGLSEGCTHTQIPVVTGAEARRLDEKFFGDTNPNTGKLRAQKNNTNIYQSCDNGSDYRTDTDGMNCSLAFVVKF